MMSHAKYRGSKPCSFEQEDFLNFSFHLPWQPEFFVEFNSLNNLKGSHPRIIPVKFSVNLPSSFKEEGFF